MPPTSAAQGIWSRVPVWTGRRKEKYKGPTKIRTSEDQFEACHLTDSRASCCLIFRFFEERQEHTVFKGMTT